ncbi:MAG TPA: glycerate kinase [Acidimicrobiales bacterium]|nr:glycerate kinase [Acidimicrobiales bacterium]
MAAGDTVSRPAAVVLAAPDKFRGTVTARQAAEAIAHGCPASWSVKQIPLSDGGEGLLEVLGVLGGERERTEVEGPLGEPVVAEWLLAGRVAVVEMARASGLLLAGGAEGNDAVAATTRGTGELIHAAALALDHPPPGADRGRVIVGLGGSATTDGGLGALRAVEEAGGLGTVELVGACDVNVGFFEAVTRFARQKGATDEQMDELAARFDSVAGLYRRDYGLEVGEVAGAGAAGGLGAAIVALGGSLRSGYEVVTELLAFRPTLAASSVVVTGEGALDATSFAGKAVGSVVLDAADVGVPCLVVAGRTTDEAVEMAVSHGARVVSLSRRYGDERARSDTARCIAAAVSEYLESTGSSST